MIALGSHKNIKDVDACITRLRLKLHDSSLIDKKKLESLGASGVINIDEQNIHVIFGIKSEDLKENIKNIISTSPQTKELILKSPLAGDIVNIEDVPDEVFAQKFLGDGVAINPSSNIVTSPIEGTITQLFSTKHAICIKAESGVEVLIHIGIDTVKLKGKGFTSFVKKGDKIKTGNEIMELDLDLIKKHAKSIITPILITNVNSINGFNIMTKGKINNKENLLKIYL